MRGSSAGSSPRTGGSSRAASNRASSGARCQCPSGCSACAVVCARIVSASSVHSLSRAASGATAAIRRSPAAQIRRLCVQARSSNSQMPASGSFQRAAMAATAISAACRPSRSSRSWRAAAAKSNNASPNTSSWNWRLTWFPIRSKPLDSPAVRACAGRERARRRPCTPVSVSDRPRAGGRRRTEPPRPARGVGRPPPPPGPRSTGRGSTRSGSRSCARPRTAPGGLSWLRRPCLRRHWSCRAVRRTPAARRGRRRCRPGRVRRPTRRVRSVTRCRTVPEGCRPTSATR